MFEAQGYSPDELKQNVLAFASVMMSPEFAAAQKAEPGSKPREFCEHLVRILQVEINPLLRNVLEVANHVWPDVAFEFSPQALMGLAMKNMSALSMGGHKNGD